MNNTHPKVFISYSWEDEDHKLWVRQFTDKLIRNGVDATLDQYDLSLGDRLPYFMEQSIRSADYVLIICTPTYKEKSDARKGGVGYEGHIISDELLSKNKERKFIPIIRKGTIQVAMPNCLAGKLGIEFTDDDSSNTSFSDLITTLYGGAKKPPLCTRPIMVKQVIPSEMGINSSEGEPIHILGIITDKVTMPKMDGTKGSALYQIPFRLSMFPSSLWRDLFIEAWNYPPSFSLKHRPGIASIHGDEIWLNGTTIEEVKQYHRDTLVLCVEVANQQEEKALAETRVKKGQEDARTQKHHNNVEHIARDVLF